MQFYLVVLFVLMLFLVYFLFFFSFQDESLETRAPYVSMDDLVFSSCNTPLSQSHDQGSHPSRLDQHFPCEAVYLVPIAYRPKVCGGLRVNI